MDTNDLHLVTSIRFDGQSGSKSGSQVSGAGR